VSDFLSENLTKAQSELYLWIKDYIQKFQHSPTIRQMMDAMGLRSPAPIQSRLKHLQDKGYITWQEGKARTMQLAKEVFEGVPILGSIAAGGLIEATSYSDQTLNLTDTVEKKGVFALVVNGDSMIDAFIADGDMVLIEPLESIYSLKNGDIVSAMVPGLGTTLKYFFKKNNKVSLEAANQNYDPILLDLDQLEIQGKLIAVWRKI
tara:strand:+ start:1206 stop:1823 length:618 start_codon:yes stop_codon:yes gene_type:complete